VAHSFWTAAPPVPVVPATPVPLPVVPETPVLVPVVPETPVPVPVVPAAPGVPLFMFEDPHAAAAVIASNSVETRCTFMG
jgi:hypothetical protein